MSHTETHIVIQFVFSGSLYVTSHKTMSHTETHIVIQFVFREDFVTFRS